jgi:hypothetical protein
MQMRASALVGTVVVGGAAALGLGLARGGADAISAHPGSFVALTAFTAFLQLLSLRVPGKGSVGVSAVGILAAGIALGPGAATAIAVVAAFVQFARTRGLVHRALFDAGNFALSAGAAGLVYEHVADSRRAVQVAAAVLAGLVYTSVNHGLLCLAMGSSESRSPVAVWQERFHWARFHFLAFGLLGAAAGLLAGEVSLATLVGLAVPPALVALSLRHRLRRATPKTA